MDLNHIKQVHFIAVGGSVMHNLALALQKRNIKVTGSDDEIYEPAAGKLKAAGLNPSIGWNPDQLHKDLDAVILGMHAKEDNPELKKAQELGLRIFSFPEFIREVSANKQRIVIGGSHGKSSITAMIMHVLKSAGKTFDYLVGAEIEGFDLTVQISDAAIIIIEGDEYLSSKLDPQPKFLKYDHHIGVISGIKWDHKNVFPTFEDYTKQFDLFADKTPKAGSLIYCEEDNLANIVGAKEREDVRKIPYAAHDAEIKNGITYLKTKEHGEVKINVFGKHNLQNIKAAQEVCDILGVPADKFYAAITSFKGAKNRLELLAENNDVRVYKDYAHAPSKLKATVNALHHQFKHGEICIAYELHTFSSLDREFLKEYKDTLKHADVAFVYINPANLKIEGDNKLTEADLKEAFNKADLQFFDDENELKKALDNQKGKVSTFAFLSSGHFGNLNLQETAQNLVK
ncbi:peptidoglycan synthetase [Marivirga tractuosa]|uniref:Cytoplasmic peptidoglycan synthetase domain protein n=1 Tax=Marivirga tractuosa (strain ATCC 23168 / DSM 4126 / NBRC 15989 / NCIMB 1408 / VKM B-1430 / H-43) TaxID=643867 RepID=E4TKF0_MARTH|nr:Mur ligase family protein [Marivirga tractuosa]ADR20130.1 cytoplasmic peptidoglycan synthetase domain protein [Marivirga tractuosa DSM 4126]BDD15429.1 peptidoglycan synthetase [Marivirga tractuosa]